MSACCLLERYLEDEGEGAVEIPRPNPGYVLPPELEVFPPA